MASRSLNTVIAVGHLSAMGELLRTNSHTNYNFNNTTMLRPRFEHIKDRNFLKFQSGNSSIAWIASIDVILAVIATALCSLGIKKWLAKRAKVIGITHATKDVRNENEPQMMEIEII